MKAKPASLPAGQDERLDHLGRLEVAVKLVQRFAKESLAAMLAISRP